MKKLILIVAAMFAAVSFSACSDDDDNGGKAPTPEKWVKQIVFRLVQDELWTTTTSITYDSENRIKKVDDLVVGDYEFTYNGNSLIVKSDDRTYTCKLNSDGYVTEITEDDFDKDETYYYKMEYKNGYLQRVEKGYDSSEPRLGVTEYKWSNGNLVEIREADYDSGDFDAIQKFFYSETATPININLLYLICQRGGVPAELGLLGFCGRQSAKLVSESDYFNYMNGIEVYSEHDSYGYTFNPDGTVKSMNHNGNSFLELIY